MRARVRARVGARVRTRVQARVRVRARVRARVRGRVRLLELLHSTPTEPSKVLIRSVSSDSTETKTVRYNTLRPLASPRPSRMH